ncbi:hypothetical protein ACIGCK_04765 [Microbacterium sp. NPDC078428]|uniref:hypothetical protein n=1 Tax=Microbacterium sp. NPDC078428 TaxID=3364190 RepID=UPI0037C7AB0A
MVGQDRAASQADVAAIIHAEAFMNVHRDPKKRRDPFTLPGPWSTKDPNADVTPERRAELEEQLGRRSAFA